jgi:hypothetical protein
MMTRRRGGLNDAEIGIGSNLISGLTCHVIFNVLPDSVINRVVISQRQGGVYAQSNYKLKF